MKLHNSKSGFTLIELLVVIGILAVLAAIAIPSVAGLIDRANVSADATNANEMTNAIERFASEYELYRQDLASGTLNLSNLDSVQGRVLNVIKASTRGEVEQLEGESGFSGRKIDRDTKYPLNAETTQAIIENYTKTSSSTFEPKQSDKHFWYSPDCGVVVVADPNSSATQRNELIVSGMDAKGNTLSASTGWINLTLASYGADAPTPDDGETPVTPNPDDGSYYNCITCGEVKSELCLECNYCPDCCECDDSDGEKCLSCTIETASCTNCLCCENCCTCCKDCFNGVAVCEGLCSSCCRKEHYHPVPEEPVRIAICDNCHQKVFSDERCNDGCIGCCENRCFETTAEQSIRSCAKCGIRYHATEFCGKCGPYCIDCCRCTTISCATCGVTLPPDKQCIMCDECTDCHLCY